MNASWAIKIELPITHAAAALRLLPGLEGCVVGGALWLRGISEPADLDRLLLKTGCTRYAVDDAGQVTRVGDQVPCGKLPEGPWIKGTQLLRITSPVAALPAAQPDRAAIKLQRGGALREATVLRARFDDFFAYAVNAPLLRLQGLRFATSAEGEVLLWGACLPPIAGRRFAETSGIAIPCGFVFSPAVEEVLLARMLGVTGGALAIFDEDAACEIIPADCFAPVRRSAVRRTAVGIGSRMGGAA